MNSSKETADEGITTEGWGSPYVNSEYGVSMVYPEGWEKIEGHVGTLVSFFCRDDPTMRTSVNLLLQDISTNISLEEYSNEAVEHMRMSLPGTEVRVWEAPMFGQNGRRLQFTAELGPFDVKVLQAWTVAKDKAYIMTFSAPADVHNSYRELIEKVIASLKLIKVEHKDRPIELLCLRYYENPTHLFRVRFPRTWTVMEPLDGAGPIVQAKYEDILSDRDQETYTLTADVTISTLPDASWGNEEYKDIALMRLGDLAGGEENIQLKDTKLGGQPAIQARYTSPTAGTTNLHVFTVKEGKAYNIAFSTNTPKTDTRPYPIFARILSSFSVLPADYTSKKHLLVMEHLVHKISFEFPEEGWTAQQNMMSVIGFDHGMTEEGAPRSNLNLMMTNLELSPIKINSLDEFAAIIREQLDMTVATLSIVHERNVKMAGKDAREIRYRGTISDRELGFQQTFTIFNNTAYVISFTAMMPDFESELEQAMPIISSFSFL